MWYLTSFVTGALDGVTSFLRLKDVTDTCEHMRRSLNISGSASVQWRKVGRSWWLHMCFCRLLCIRIEIDQLQSVNCWLIIHCLSVSCTNIKQSCYALVLWSLQLTSKQWIIKQFTAGADLFLEKRPIKCHRMQHFIRVVSICYNKTNCQGQKYKYCKFRNFVRILLSPMELKDIFAMLKLASEVSWK